MYIQYQTVPPPPRTHFVSDKDELILEDETQRVTLCGMLDVNKVVTGCVVAVIGRLHSNGIFQVQDYCWPESESIAKPLSELNDDRLVKRGEFRELCIELSLISILGICYSLVVLN